jgi:hypothetical protein
MVIFATNIALFTSSLHITDFSVCLMPNICLIFKNFFVLGGQEAVTYLVYTIRKKNLRVYDC